jgi:hypothetical protein
MTISIKSIIGLLILAAFLISLVFVSTWQGFTCLVIYFGMAAAGCWLFR